MIQPKLSGPNQPAKIEVAGISFTQEEIDALLRIAGKAIQEIREEMDKVKTFPKEKIDFFVLARDITKMDPHDIKASGKETITIDGIEFTGEEILQLQSTIPEIVFGMVDKMNDAKEFPEQAIDFCILARDIMLLPL